MNIEWVYHAPFILTNESRILRCTLTDPGYGYAGRSLRQVLKIEKEIALSEPNMGENDQELRKPDID
ncbi:MAG: hypothetical protein MJA27_12130 [Pseudanabaenales cyanobacterium]|nr:hypothetical protein [Pseudanabaenales cyanobacterium]